MIQSLREIGAPMRALSGHIATALEGELPAPVVEKAQHHILDTLAAMISGAALLPGRMALRLAQELGGPAECTIVGSDLRLSMINAALVNGMLAHADETDDSHAPSRNHPGCAVIPAALAAAEKSRAGGRAFLRAVVLGYDVAARLNYALGPDAFAATSRATHSFGGTFGAGAAAGALLGLDAMQARYLLSYCAQQASGVGSNVRDSEHVEKAFDFAGMPARNGATAALMASIGCSGVDDVFSGERNFLEAYAAQPDPQALADGLGLRHEILLTNIKKWCVGSPAQSALDAVTYLMENEGLTAAMVESILIHLPTRSARTVDSAPMPNVNVQHLAAMLLVDGKLTFDSVHDEPRMQDAAILALRRKIRLQPSDELMTAIPRRQAIVEVATTDGRLLSRRTRAVRGTADNPMSREEVEEKARDLMAKSLGGAAAERLIERVRRLETVADIGELTALWNGGGAARRSAS